MKLSPEATYERARRLANLAIWTILLQCRRVRSEEPEDDEFVMRRWHDFQFLIVALARLRRAANLAMKIDEIKIEMESAILDFDSQLPYLKIMRDVAEHINDYVIDKGRNKNIGRKELEVSVFGKDSMEWLGYELNIDSAMKASKNLFKAIQSNG